MKNIYNTIPSDSIIEKAAQELRKNNFTVEIVSTGEDAKVAALKLIPLGAEVLTATSVTADTIGLSQEIDDSGKYDSVMQKLKKMDRSTQNSEMQKLGSAPDYVVGSVHAITQDGHLLIASSSGSQLPSEVYGALQVIYVVGAQKIVKNIEEGMKRIYEYCLPLENKRALKAYGSGSKVRKLLINNEEKIPNRTHVILIKESIGY